MGCGASSDNYLDPVSEKRNGEIEKQLASDRARLANEVKVGAPPLRLIQQSPGADRLPARRSCSSAQASRASRRS